MKRVKNIHKIIILILSVVLILPSAGGNVQQPWEKENVSFPMMNQEIKNALEEDERQGNLLKNQGINTAEEKVNEEQHSKFRKNKEKINDRLRIITHLIHDIGLGASMIKSLDNIKKYQEEIWKEIFNTKGKDALWVIPIATEAQITFVKDMEDLIKYAIAIVLETPQLVKVATAGTQDNKLYPNQRRQIVNHLLEEIRLVEHQSFKTLRTLRKAKQNAKDTRNAFMYYVIADKRIIESIKKEINSIIKKNSFEL